MGKLPSSGLLATAAGVFLALAALLALPRPGAGAPSEPALELIALDVSDSVRAGRPGWLSQLRGAALEACAAAAGRGSEVQLVAFGATARTLAEPQPADELARRLDGASGAPLALAPTSLSPLDSRLDLALALGREALLDPARFPGRAGLIGDGRASAGAAATLAEWRAAGTAVEWRDLGRGSAPELALTGVSAPRRIDAGRSFEVDLHWALLAGTWPQPLEVEVERHTSEGVERERHSLLAPRSGTRATTSLTLAGAADGLLELRVRWAGGDTLEGNHSGSAQVRVGERRTIGVAVNAGARAAVEAALASDRWNEAEWFFGEPEEVAARLDAFDLLLLADVPPDAFPPGLLGPWVRGGGGLLALMGERLLRPDPDGADFDLLPLVPAPPDRPPREVALLMDGSGSMEGAPFETVRAAAIELIDALPRGDRLTLRLFTRAPTRPVVLADGESRDRAAAAQRLLSLRLPGGATEILSSIEAVLERRHQAGEDQPCLLVLMSDGRESDFVQLPQRLARLEDLCASRRIERFALAVGEDANLSHLVTLVGAAERVVRVERLDALRQALLAAVQSERIRPGPVPLTATPRGPLSADFGGPSAWPDLDRFTTARLAEGATLLFSDDRDAPGGALWRVGAGSVASLIGGPLPGWGSAWSGRPELLADLVRFLSRSANDAPELIAREDGLRLVGLRERALLELPAVLEWRALDGSLLERRDVLFGAPQGRLRAGERWLPWSATGAVGWQPGELRVRIPEGLYAGSLAVARPLPPEWRDGHPALPAGALGPGFPPRALPLPVRHPASLPLAGVGLGLVLLALLRPSRRRAG
ncbi:MAG: VWA domain-containing protein, partial [Planctomycetota bacterium]